MTEKTIATRTFVIGDIHGCALTLRKLITQILRPTRSDRIILLGDLIDRGADSKGVLDFIFEMQQYGLTVHAVRGNHEEMFLKACEDHYYLNLWCANGGIATMASFQADGPGDISRRYRDYIESLPLYLLLDNFVIVHAGLNFDLPDPFQDTVAMLWSRSPFVDRQRIGGRRLICGHTTIARIEMIKSLTSDKIMLDNGCVFIERSGMGNLAALELGNMKLILQPNLDIR